MSKKINIGIDINEIFRAKSYQVDKFYIQEFGELGIPNETYVFDYFNKYKWEDTVEIKKELKEPEDMPENISPLEYQINNKLGEAPADAFLFKKSEEIKLTAKEIYNRFMYEDFVYEIHGSAPLLYKGMDYHVNQFYIKYKYHVNFILYSKENYFSIPSTLFFLSKMTSRFKNIKFIDNSADMWNDVDILITTDPEILKLGTPWFKKLIKVERPYNENINAGILKITNIHDLNGNKQFEKIIKFK